MGLFREIIQSATGNYGKWEDSTPPKRGDNGRWEPTPELLDIEEYDLHRLINLRIVKGFDSRGMVLTDLGQLIFERLADRDISHTPNNIWKEYNKIYP